MTDSPLAMLPYADWPEISAAVDRVRDDVLAEFEAGTLGTED